MKTRYLTLSNLIFGLLAMLIAMTTAPAVFAQTSDADAVVIRPLSLVPVEDLNFGNLIAGPTPGTAVVSTAGVRTTSGGVTAAGGTVSNAEFQGLGSPGRFVFVSTASSTYTLTRSGGGGTMTMNQLTLQADNLTPRFFPGLFQINTSDVIILRVGATLNVGANQPGGVYVGTFPMTINYF